MNKKVSCAYCGQKESELHRDHVVPRSRGGPDNAFNIVMACAACNMAKGSDLPSEWLGSRCPAAVSEIEERVNRQLETRFKKRDGLKSKPSGNAREYVAFHQMQNGGVDYIGEVISELEGTIRMEVLDGIMTYFGTWWLSGEVRDCPRKECKLWLFDDRLACLEQAIRINESIYGTR